MNIIKREDYTRGNMALKDRKMRVGETVVSLYTIYHVGKAS